MKSVDRMSPLQLNDKYGFISSVTQPSERKSFLFVALNGSFSFLEMFLDLCHLPTQHQLFGEVFTLPHLIKVSLRCKYYVLLLSEKQSWIREKKNLSEVFL